MGQETSTLIALVLAIFAVLFFRRRFEDKYLKKKVLDSVSEELRKEIEDERRINREKKEKFESALKNATSKPHDKS